MARRATANVGSEVSELIDRTLQLYLADPTKARRVADQGAAPVPEETRSALDAVLEERRPSYRDGLIIQLAFGLVGDVDHTKRPPGGRGVAQRLGALFKQSHIRGVDDAYQNIAKNSEELCRGNVPTFDALLVWANIAPEVHRRAAFSYALARVSLTARPVSPMPDLDRGKLTFTAVCGLLEELLALPSGGAHEQFSVAAFIEALTDEFDMGGSNRLRVVTKPINASDQASGAGGDIEIRRGNRIEEAFEVSANAWDSKVRQASDLVRQLDLQRVHIVAATPGGFTRGEMLNEGGRDLTVLDIRSLLSTATAIMRKPAREYALRRLYELLERNQPDINRVNTYVDLIRKHGLVA